MGMKRAALAMVLCVSLASAVNADWCWTVVASESCQDAHGNVGGTNVTCSGCAMSGGYVKCDKKVHKMWRSQVDWEKERFSVDQIGEDGFMDSQHKLYQCHVSQTCKTICKWDPVDEIFKCALKSTLLDQRVDDDKTAGGPCVENGGGGGGGGSY